MKKPARRRVSFFPSLHRIIPHGNHPISSLISSNFFRNFKVKYFLTVNLKGSTTKSLLRLLPYLKRYRNQLVWGLTCVAIADIFAVIAPWVLKHGIDWLETGVTIRRIGLIALILVLLALVGGIFRYLMRWKVIGISRYIEQDVRSDLFRHLTTLPQTYYDKTRTGVMYPVNTAVSVALSMTMMLWISPGLTLYILLIGPIISASVYALGQKIFRHTMLIQEQYSNLNDFIQENLAGVRIVRSFLAEQAQEDQFDGLNREYLSRNIAMIRVQSMFMPLIFTLFTLGTAVILWFGGRKIIMGELSLGDFVAFIAYLGILSWPMIALGWVVNLYQRGAASMSRINRILDTKPENYGSTETQLNVSVEGDIEFRNVSFKYPGTDRWVLRNIDLTVPRGTKLAVVGRTGSGKSTLVGLITRLWEVTEGEILIGGTSINDYSLEKIRNAIGFVPQDSLLFSTNIRNNISMGKPDAEDDAVEYAATVSGIHPDIQDFPKGYQTPVGERGITLSGGQKQRTALARALLRQPEILILDDALSSVDTQTEETVLEQLKEVMANRTTMMVAHRISTIQDADQIIVLEDGEIAEQGTHSELLKLNGLYADSYRKQQLRQKLDEL